MKKYYAYTRVSTIKQGEKGVSLQEQHDAIARYAERQGLQITEWFEERVTAAKQGRPLFMRMIKGLRLGRANGLIIHKIDRGARNLRDWADLGELIDSGVSVHFANDNLDLHSRGGRLSADIQAVVASDYIRNLREETIKGLYGRLKQGIYPFRAPIGYLDTGGGRVKDIDPLRGPLIREAFSLYASDRYSLDSLRVELHRRGLRNLAGDEVSLSGMSTILNNPFYAGLIRIRKTGDSYAGKHPPLIPMALFKQVQARLAGRIHTQKSTHDFTYRGLFRCSLCERHLIAERQKGHIYYRCHTRDCPTRTFREEVLEASVVRACPPLVLTPEWTTRLAETLDAVQHEDIEQAGTRAAQVQVQLGAITTRLARLTDAFVDGLIDKATFDERRLGLLEQQRSLEDSSRSGAQETARLKQYIMERLELACNAQQSHALANPAARRELAIQLCSNRTVAAKEVSVEPYFPLQLIAQSKCLSNGDHYRGTARTDTEIARRLLEWAHQELEKCDEVAERHNAPVRLRTSSLTSPMSTKLEP
jgi:DNA invertase Pin-like site-specific DNA recombinase